MTLDSPKELEVTYETIRNNYRQLRNHLRSEEETSLDFVEDVVEEQSKLFDKIEQSPELVEQYRSQNESQLRSTVEEIESIRSDVESLLEGEWNALKGEVNTADQALQLMGEYKQEEDETQYLDEKI